MSKPTEPSTTSIPRTTISPELSAYLEAKEKKDLDLKKRFASSGVASIDAHLIDAGIWSKIMEPFEKIDFHRKLIIIICLDNDDFKDNVRTLPNDTKILYRAFYIDWEPHVKLVFSAEDSLYEGQKIFDLITSPLTLTSIHVVKLRSLVHYLGTAFDHYRRFIEYDLESWVLYEGPKIFIEKLAELYVRRVVPVSAALEASLFKVIFEELLSQYRVNVPIYVEVGTPRYPPSIEQMGKLILDRGNKIIRVSPIDFAVLLTTSSEFTPETFNLEVEFRFNSVSSERAKIQFNLCK